MKKIFLGIVGSTYWVEAVKVEVSYPCVEDMNLLDLDPLALKDAMSQRTIDERGEKMEELRPKLKECGGNLFLKTEIELEKSYEDFGDVVDAIVNQLPEERKSPMWRSIGDDGDELSPVVSGDFAVGFLKEFEDHSKRCAADENQDEEGLQNLAEEYELISKKVSFERGDKLRFERIDMI